MLPKKEQDILVKCYGVFGYAQAPLDEIAMYHFMKTDAVEKARNRALVHLQKLMREYPNPWTTVEAMIRRACRECGADMQYSTPQGVWFEDEWELKQGFPELVRALIAAFIVMHEVSE